MNLQAGEETAERFAMYLLDWDRLGRTQRVEVIDTATGLLLDTREVGDLGEGVYVVYDIRRERSCGPCHRGTSHGRRFRPRLHR